MCDLHDHHGLPPLEADEFVLDTPFVRDARRDGARGDRTVGDARPRRASDQARVRGGARVDRDWLPAEFQRDVPDSGMGGGIGQWLLFRSADRSLCLFSLVVPSGSMTPIHDHLAWGLVGLYQGNQDEEFYAPGAGTIELTRRRPLAPGDYYVLLPPADDIHRVRTTSAETSVSIHLLANDTGCTDRHTFDEQHRRRERLPLGLRERRLRELSPSGLGGLRLARARTSGRRGPRRERRRLVGGQRLLELPLPVAGVGRARSVHPGLGAEAEQILGRDDHEVVLDGEHVLEEARCSPSTEVAPAASCGWFSRPQRCHQPASVSESWVEV